jgi:DNA repair protein RadC
MDDARAGGVAEAGLCGDGLPPAAPVPREAVPAPPPGYLGHRARLRRRLVDGGPAALLDHELLEAVLFLALPRRDTKPMAHALMRRFGGFADAIAAPPVELGAVPGLGEAGVAVLKAVEAAAVRLRAVAAERPVLSNWKRLVDYLTAALAYERVERLRVLHLDLRGRLIADEAQGTGAVNHSPVCPREVVRRALEVGATALILVRNHPSGGPTPSRADVEVAAAVKAAGAVFGIAVHDHLIVGNGRHISLRREGLL